MKSPGIEIRPIKQISGGANFNEVYFNDVRVPDDQRLGAVGQGWQVALTTLMNERLAIGAGGLGGGVGFRQVFNLARKLEIDGEPAIRDRNVRAKLATWYAQETGLKYTGYRALSALSRGDTPGPENSIGKLVAASKTQDMASFAMDLLELSGAVSDPAPRRGARDLSSDLHGCPREPHRRRQRRDHAEHPLRAGPRAAPGRPCRQGNPVQRGADGKVAGLSTASTGDQA